MSKKIKPLDDFESEWMQDIGDDQIKSDKTTLKRLSNNLMVDQSLKKSHPLSLRIPDADLEAIQMKASRAGIPYQTLIKSVLHKFATGQLQI